MVLTAYETKRSRFGPISDLYGIIRDCVRPDRLVFEDRLPTEERPAGFDRRFERTDFPVVSARDLKIELSDGEVVNVEEIENDTVVGCLCSVNGNPGHLMISKELRLMPSETDCYDVPVCEWTTISVYGEHGDLLFAAGSDKSEQIQACVDDLCTDRTISALPPEHARDDSEQKTSDNLGCDSYPEYDVPQYDYAEAMAEQKCKSQQLAAHG